MKSAYRCASHHLTSGSLSFIWKKGFLTKVLHSQAVCSLGSSSSRADHFKLPCQDQNYFAGIGNLPLLPRLTKLVYSLFWKRFCWKLNHACSELLAHSWQSTNSSVNNWARNIKTRVCGKLPVCTHLKWVFSICVKTLCFFHIYVQLKFYSEHELLSCITKSQLTYKIYIRT